MSYLISFVKTKGTHTHAGPPKLQTRIMASKDDVPAGFVSVSLEMTESIKRAICKPSIKSTQAVKVENKIGKLEDKILVLAMWRLYLMTPKLPTKVEQTFNFLEVRAMSPQPENQVAIDTEKSTYIIRLQSSDHMDQLLSHVSYALSCIFNNSIYAPSILQTDGYVPDGRHKYSPSSETSVEAQRACGGFSETYSALCDYNGVLCKEEVKWDVDTIYHSQDNRELNLLDFSHLESRDLAVIVASLAYNTWFTKIYCKDLRLGSEVVEQVLHTVSKSSSLEELTLENTGLKADFPQKMAVALSENPASVIHSLNLSHNTFDNQAVSNLIQQVYRLSKGLCLLNLSKTTLSSKGVGSLSQALCSSNDYLNSLLHLDLSKNPGILSGEDATNLYLFLAQPNCLVHLDLSGTDCAVDTLFSALLRGCCADLSYLNLSKNCFCHRKVKETLPTFRQFLSLVFSLSHLSLASMKMPPEVLRDLFLGLSSNPHITDLHLDISGCELRSAGAAVMQELLPQVSCISTLDISNNGLDADFLSVIPAFSRHPSLKHLMLGKNFNVKGRILDEILQRLVQLVQEEECGLQSLSLADSRLRSRGTVLVNALGSNACLRNVDISGNLLEDTGARMLSKALQINTTLRSVTWDRNNTTAAGFQDVARSLQHNFTLQFMPLPLSDITQAYRSAPERTELAVMKIQKALLRNNQTQRFSQKQALRLHQGLVTSTTEQVMERLCARVQQQVCVLRGAGEAEELQAARQILKEARNSRALYPSLCELAHVFSADGQVRQKLESLTAELATAADKELQVIVDSMVSLCQELCPLSCTAEHLAPLLSTVSEHVSIPRSAIRSALMEKAADDIHQALEEVKLSVVSYLTNSVVDQILQDLYSTHKTLLQHVAEIRHMDDSATMRPMLQYADNTDIVEDDNSINIDTIAIKQHSSRTRRIRPVSTRPSLDDETSTTPMFSEPHQTAQLNCLPSWENLSDLPTQGTPLQHVTSSRPHPPRRHRPGHAPQEMHSSENGGVNLLDNGMPDSYSKRVLESQPSSQQYSQILRQKKRPKVLSFLSGFRKSRCNESYQDSEATSQTGTCGNRCRTNDTTENLYSEIQKDRKKAEPVLTETNSSPGAQRASQPSPCQTFQAIPLPRMRGVTPSCTIKKEFSDYSEVLGSTEDVTFIIEDLPRLPDRHTEGQNVCKLFHKESDVEGLNSPTSELKTEEVIESQAHESKQRPQPPPQSSKPRLYNARQCHLEENCESTEDIQEKRNYSNAKKDDICPEEQQQKSEQQTPPIIEQFKSQADTSPEKYPTLTPSFHAHFENKVPPPVPPARGKPVTGWIDSPFIQD
ncbi:capping protein, Arp2/3 and myosin-I linker protein 3 [Trichomycterus rosablanca]|uniref:capping protein, Arp2/3 and myosin-I linker protein 3 n=1 Tax=Trichomycterus rosablanca TaxID=2290929 RepID=UPI002F35DC98